ncbi:MAG TPA: hypothetical protein VEJ63_05680 [Planctomycetota bacterium]|nr:hypothetical protein [Planctomycetota bacterium]
MPSPRRRSAGRHDTVSYRYVLEACLSGLTWAYHPVTADDVRAAWQEHGAEILRAWIKAFPGSRPFAWWATREDRPEFNRDPQERARQECDYLKAHGLITAKELEAMKNWKPPKPTAEGLEGYWTVPDVLGLGPLPTPIVVSRPHEIRL